MNSFENWDELCDAFRAVGGVVDNVSIRSQNNNRSLFALDPSKPILIHLPTSLQVPIEDVELEDGNLGLRKGSDFSEAYKEFFHRYHKSTSWSQGGRKDIEDFFYQMQALPERVKAVLENKFNFQAFLNGGDESAVLNRFIESRSIRINKKAVLMPMLELANHSARGMPYKISNGITLSGNVKSEVLAFYSMSDSWHKFRDYGFAIPERYAFSQGYNIKRHQGPGLINVLNNLSANEKLEGKFFAPQVTKKGTSVDISYLMIGDRGNLSAPKHVFDKVISEHLGKGADEFFEILSYNNKNKFLTLLAACEDDEGPMISTLRTVCRYQLEALSHCVFGKWPAAEDA
ncbi:MAG: hypothetical protein ACJAWL_000347 [Motiliproteus sp.]|jgi:hypothetical protein